jgi:hypothetical protein
MPAPKDPVKYKEYITKLQNKAVTQETRDKMSKAKKGIPLSEEHKKKISESNTGRIKSEEECKNISGGLKGKPKSEEHKQRLSESLMGHTPWNVGVSPSEETRKKIGKSHIGMITPPEVRLKQSVSMIGNIPWNVGISPSKETKQKMSDSHKGEKSPMWKGGITPLNRAIRRLPEYDLWISSIFERDNYTCQKCNKHGGDLNAHHIKEFSRIIEENKISSTEEALLCEELWDLNNGITLCIKCHKKEHSIKQ